MARRSTALTIAFAVLAEMADLRWEADGPCLYGILSTLNCGAAAVPGGERVVSAEEVFELRFRTQAKTLAPSVRCAAEQNEQGCGTGQSPPLK